VVVLAQGVADAFSVSNIIQAETKRWVVLVGMKAHQAQAICHSGREQPGDICMAPDITRDLGQEVGDDLLIKLGELLHFNEVKASLAAFAATHKVLRAVERLCDLHLRQAGVFACLLEFFEKQLVAALMISWCQSFPLR
jgi:hypothetical protein